MGRYPEDAQERMMKVQEVILRALAKRLTWWQAAGLSSGSPPEKLSANRPVSENSSMR